MSKASEALKALDIFNPHNAATFARQHGGVGVYLSYRPQQTGRAFQCAAWQVVRPGFKTDPNGHWRNYGHKTFNVFDRIAKHGQEQAARDWAGQRYDIPDWASIPGLPGALFPAGDAQIIRDALRTAQKATTP